MVVWTSLSGRTGGQRRTGGGDRSKSEEQPHAKQIAAIPIGLRYLLDVFASASIARDKSEISRRCAMASAV
jgi:hypothetical protein